MLTPHRLHLAALSSLLAALCWAGLAPAGAATPAGHAGTARHVMGLHRSHAGAKQQSLNWAGYVRTGGSFRSVSGSWTVPSLKSTHDGFSSTWVGIDGATSSDRYLIQTGTEADVSGGRRSYRAWWEVITPSDAAPETLFNTLTISPGDSMSASVTKNPSGTWTMSLRDNTSGRSASHTTAFAGPGSTVEWIQEDTWVNGAISTAPNWGSVTFRRLLLNHANPNLKASEAVDIVDSHGTREAVTGAPAPSGSGFTVTWLATGTRTVTG